MNKYGVDLLYQNYKTKNTKFFQAKSDSEAFDVGCNIARFDHDCVAFNVYRVVGRQKVYVKAPK